jgi:hypothetical protein
MTDRKGTQVGPSRGVEVEPLKILRQWHRGLSISHKAHAVAATAFHHRNLYLGIPVVLLSTIAGTAIFGSLESSPEIWAKIFVGLLSLAAAILASLQTFLRYSELSEGVWKVSKDALRCVHGIPK